MRIADKEKEEKFVEHYTNTGNAKESALASGYNSKSACSMGHYLKKKFALEIEEKQKEKLQGMSGKSLGVLDRLLNADSDNVKLNACKLILECNGFTKDSNLNVNVKSEYSTKTDDELIEMLLSLKPELKEKFN
jgi:hypothetical protein